MKLFARVVLWLFVGLAVFAPLIANDQPLVAWSEDQQALSFPAFAEYSGASVEHPSGYRDWRAWWQGLDERSGDWAVMPPWDVSPREVFSGRQGEGPSWSHPLGNDEIGRDLLARLIHGASTALWTAGVGVCLALFTGVLLGLLAGYFGGWIDLTVLRLIEVLMCFPVIITGMAVGAILGGSAWVLAALIGLVYSQVFARIVRGEVLSLRSREFVHSARELGVGVPALLLRHLLPCVREPLAAAVMLVTASSIVLEASLSFLGLGTGLREVSWGAMLASGREAVAVGAWHQLLVPSSALVIVLLALHVASSSSASLNSSLTTR